MGSGQISKIRIVIAASNLMTFRLLARTLERSLDLQVVATVGTKDGLFKSLQDTKPDIALISIHLQDGLFSSFAHLQEISHRFPNLPWVLLLDRTEPQLVVDAFRAGARGVFSCSESETKVLGKCVRCVVKGEIWADTAQVDHIVQALTGASSDSQSSRGQALSLLTAREETLVRLVANGLSNRDIAQHLGPHLREAWVFQPGGAGVVCHREAEPSRVPVDGRTLCYRDTEQWSVRAWTISGGPGDLS